MSLKTEIKFIYNNSTAPPYNATTDPIQRPYLNITTYYGCNPAKFYRVLNLTKANTGTLFNSTSVLNCGATFIYFK